MPSSRAVLTDIVEFKLNPSTAHVINRDGRLQRNVSGTHVSDTSMPVEEATVVLVSTDESSADVGLCVDEIDEVEDSFTFTALLVDEPESELSLDEPSEVQNVGDDDVQLVEEEDEVVVNSELLQTNNVSRVKPKTVTHKKRGKNRQLKS